MATAGKGVIRMTDASSDSARTAESRAGGRVGSWQLDPARSVIAIRHKSLWGLVTVKGTFTEVSGQGEVLADGSARGSLTVGAPSVDTGNARRDAHLRSAAFLDADRDPSIAFTALRITPGADGTAEVSGDLTARGLTRPLVFSARVTESATGAVTLAAEVIIDRSRYGMTWNMLGMITGPAAVTVTACFSREQP
jgi:polyisoprenoid-binding protein YceI